jgi:hypothetical protein
MYSSSLEVDAFALTSGIKEGTWSSQNYLETITITIIAIVEERKQRWDRFTDAIWPLTLLLQER